MHFLNRLLLLLLRIFNFRWFMNCLNRRLPMILIKMFVSLFLIFMIEIGLDH